MLLAVALACGGGELNADAQPQAVGRPADASTGPRVGVVVASSPGVRIEPWKGGAFAASEGVMLVRDDRLVTGSDPRSFVVVELYNGHVVRLGHGTEIAVERIAVFNAPRSGDGVMVQFEKALRPEELADDAMRGAISRVAGWNSRMTAAETVAPVSVPVPLQKPAVETELQGVEMPAEGQPDPGPRLDGSPADPLRAPERGGPGKPAVEPNSRPGKLPTSKPNGPHGAGDEAGGLPTTQSPMPEPPSSADAKKASESKKPDLADKVQFKRNAGGEQTIDLPAALVVEREQLAACAGAGARLRVQVENKLIRKISVVGSARVCALKTDKAVELDDGTMEIRVK